ncbi:hypothetical protein CcCBS67573_g05715 [Chytriomyces confervae]|uniref:TOG domain-containing protein n=1 Tax=Chytriomyces confervae TaxID=246404 RepID=A0A507FAM2_9FUNG|nr:hypothetical protein CcCBS67573_g05715 [Chytriomyces confervae]
MSKELAAIDAAELRIATASSEAQLKKELESLLVPLLRILDTPTTTSTSTTASPNTARVVQVCTHIARRVKSSASPVLPLPQLLALYAEAVTRTPVSNSLLSIALMFIGLATADSANVSMFSLAKAVSQRPASVQLAVFHLITPTLANYHPSDDAKHKEAVSDADLTFLLLKWMHLILYATPPAATPVGAFVPVPGLSLANVKFLTNEGKASWTRNAIALKDLKAGIIRFLQLSPLIPQNSHLTLRYLINLIATTDPAHQVASAAEDAMKRLAKPSFEDPMLVKLVYRLYQGVASTQTPSTPDTAPPNANADLYTILAASIPVKLKCLGLVLSRSVHAANEFPAFLQVSFDALYSDEATAKLRNAGIAFIQWIARMAEPTKIQPVAPILLSGLLKLIDEGAEAPDSDKDAEALRGFAYDAVGLLSKRAPQLFVNDINILKSFFKAVSTESRNVRVSVQDALSTMIEAYKNIANESDEKRVAVETILLENIEKPEHHARYAAVKYANALFPFSSPLARYLNLVASADAKLEVKEEARRGLAFPDPAESASAIPAFHASLPKMYELATFIQTMERKPRLSARAPGVKYVGGMSAEAYSNSVEFLRRVLIAKAEPMKKLEADGFLRIGGNLVEEGAGGAARISDLETRAKVRAFLKESWMAPGGMDVDGDEKGGNGKGVHVFLEVIERGLKSDEVDAVLQSTCSSCLVELVSLCPSALAESYRDKVDWIKSFLSSLKPETRHAMARVLGIVATSDLSVADRGTQFMKLVQELSTTARDFAKQTSFELRQGSVLALGYLLGRLRYRYPYTWTTYLDTSAASKVVAIIAEDLDATSTISIQGACFAISELARYGELPVAEAAMAVEGASAPEAASTEKWTRDAILKKLMEFGKTTKDTKVEEAAITALGNVAVGTPAVSEKVLDFFYTLPAILSKHVEVNFTVGDAISAVAGGFKATCMEEYLDIADVVFPPVEGTPAISTPTAGVMEKVLERCFHEIRPGGVPVSRKAVCVWLLSLVKFCGGMEQIKNNLPKIHTAFSNLISDRDEFTQEVASKGIGLVYELGDAGVKALLVESLVSTFTEGRKLAPQSVTADTTLFQEGSLGQTPDGSNLTTYQSILSLASDLNQPDLVYKFMSLASHNAVWNSRRGASMGFGSIAALAERELAPYLNQIVPKLYRFQFDPNAKVAESMKSIWRSLVKDPKKAVDDHFDVIVKDLLKGLGDRMWRTRESSCLALSELLHGRQLDQVKPFLQEVWSMCFRALDDIKESVRVAAFATCKTLTGVTVKYCDPTVVSVKAGQEIMDIVMPFFLTKGLGSKAEDVAKFSLATVLKITKKGGVLLKPHLTELISTLLESLSQLEPQVLSYLTFHTASYNITQEQLDSSRLSAAKSSPMMEAVDSCVENLDEKVMAELMPKVCSIIRKGVGLPTKAGSARFVVTLAMRVPSELRPHADNTLKALSGAVSDRSPAVRKSFATAIGHIAKLCTIPALQRLITHFKNTYTDSEDEDTRSVAGIAILEISRFSSDMFANLGSEILPLAYLGRHDANQTIKTTWTEVWEENTAGATGAVKLYLSEIMLLCSTLLTSTPSWNVKKQVGLALGDVATAIGSSVEKEMDAVIPMLTDALGGRTWEGKESVLEALVTVSVEGKGYFATHSEQLETVSKVVVREAKKNNKPYKRFALEQLGRFMDALKVDRFDELEDYLVEMATVDGDDDDDDVDAARAKPMNLAIRANAYKALGLCWPLNKETQGKWANVVLPELIKGLDGNIWNTRIAILESVGKIIEKSVAVEESVQEKTLLITSAGVAQCLTDGKYTAVREQALKVIKLVVEKVKGTSLMTENVRAALITGIDDAVSKELISSISEPLKEIRKSISGMNLD